MDDDDIRFQVTLNLDEPVPVRDVLSTLRDVDALLADIERQVADGHNVKWDWGGFDVPVAFMAHPNGVPSEQLKQIVGVAQEGFRRAKDAAAENRLVDWPDEFGPVARRRAESILTRLKRLESITVSATGVESIDIRQAVAHGKVEATRKRQRIHSSVEGTLRMISGSPEEPLINAAIREVRTNRYVRCRLESERWYDTVSGFWGKRVIVEGMVAYHELGYPLSVMGVTRIVPREGGRSLREFEGVAPDLTGDLSDDDFMTEIRGDG